MASHNMGLLGKQKHW